ncbi:MAG: 3-hydroxybutyrate dehydrogenase [Flavobacteriaceae bacterium]
MNTVTFNTSGKNALVTGSNSGIGLAIATKFAENGINVIINSYTDNLEDHALAKQLQDQTGSNVYYIKADLSKPEECRQLVKKANEKLGSVDILVNNAGVQHVAPIEDFGSDNWERVVSIDLSAAFHATAEVLPIMRKNGWGRIVNTASVHGLKASPHKIAYVSSKHGIVGFTKAVAVETGPEPITCNAICPGVVKTDMVMGQLEDQMKATKLSREEVMENVFFSRVPSKDFVLPEQLAAATMFLCSNDAAQITGVALPVDGGITAF